MSADSPPAADPGPSTPVGDSRQVIAIAVAALAVPLVIVAWLVAAVVPGVPWWLGVIAGIVAAVAVVAYRVRRAADSVLAGLGVVPATAEDHPRLHNLVQGLSLAGGVAEPDLYVVEDQGRNAAAVVQGDRSAVVVSTGLLDAVDRVALEGVVAEALVRIRSGDAEASTLGTALFGNLLLLGPIGPLARPAVAFGLRRLLAEDRDLVADRAAVTLTRYPPGLLTALDTIRSGSARTSGATKANEHVWLVPPSTVDRGDGGVIGAAPLDLRIDVLAEL